jgi:hypothetical protein
MTHLEFELTSWLRVVSIFALAIGNAFLIYDRYVLAIIFFAIAGLLYRMKKQIYLILHHNHHANMQMEKEHARQVQEEALAELKASRKKVTS